MKKCTLIIFLLFTLVSFAQKIENATIKLPKSIYTLNYFSEDKNGFSEVNKRLNITSYKFAFVSALDIETNRMTINSRNVGIKPSKFIYDDYNSYQNNNLLKGFLVENDPTRWNLQCIENRIQPYFLQKK